MRRLLRPAATLTLTACAAAFPSSPMPASLAPVPPGDLRAWIASTRPDRHLVLRFRWHLIVEGGSGGRGSVFIAPPDSLRLDFRGPVGFGSGAAAVVGDTAVWAEPKDQVNKFVASYPLLWAMVGVARPPGRGWTVEGARQGGLTAWRYVRGTDRVDYILRRTNVTILEALVRDAGKAVGHVTTVFDAEGHLLRSRLDVLSTQARLDITFDKAAKQVHFGREDWIAPRDK